MFEGKVVQLVIVEVLEGEARYVQGGVSGSTLNEDMSSSSDGQYIAKGTTYSIVDFYNFITCC